MVKYKSKQSSVSPETVADAERIARATQKPGQTKEQTKLIAQGIQKGIDQYKKQYKAKVRELNKKSKQLSSKPIETQTLVTTETVYKQHWLPWSLLVLTWIGVIAYFFQQGILSLPVS